MPVLGPSKGVGLYAVHGTWLQSLTHSELNINEMPLTARLRDEENERINNILKKLMALDYVPENGSEAVDAILAGIGSSTQTLLDVSPQNLIFHLEKFHFDWANAEQFADFLTLLSKKLPENKFALTVKAMAIYNYIQTESKTFSFDIFNKIAAAEN